MSIIARDLPQGPGPFQIAPPEFEWPFLVNGDSVSFICTRFYKQRIEDYNADRLAAKYLPGIYEDPQIPGSFLMAESKANRTPTALVAFTRTFARVPTPQVVYSSISINKPAASAVGVVAGLQFYSPWLVVGLGIPYSYNNYLFAPNQKVYGPIFQTTSASSAGNTLITISSTTTFNTALDLACQLGTSAGNPLWGLIAAGAWTITDATHITLTGLDVSTAALQVSQFARNYTSGNDRIRTRNTTTFYLPGISAGIATPNDIPLPDPATNDGVLLALIASSATGYQTYDAQPLDRWNGFPTYEQTIIETDMSNF